MATCADRTNNNSLAHSLRCPSTPHRLSTLSHITQLSLGRDATLIPLCLNFLHRLTSTQSLNCTIGVEPTSPHLLVSQSHSYLIAEQTALRSCQDGPPDYAEQAARLWTIRLRRAPGRHAYRSRSQPSSCPLVDLRSRAARRGSPVCRSRVSSTTSGLPSRPRAVSSRKHHPKSLGVSPPARRGPGITFPC
jgi:hypothetical protein